MTPDTLLHSVPLIAIAAFVMVFGLISGRLARSVVTPPMLFVAFGMMLGSEWADVVPLGLDNPALHIIAEMALILILFTDAARIDLRALRTEYNVPARMLVIGLPLIIIFGASVAKLLFPTLNYFEAGLLAALLAPTDAALGQAVVSNKRVPVCMRQSLNVESGLNDGIALPVVLMFAACASIGATDQPATEWVLFAGQQVVLGFIIGPIIGVIGGWLLQWGDRTEWMNHTYEKLAGLSIALLAYGIAHNLGGNGFIAAFTAGLAVGYTAGTVCRRMTRFIEAESQLVALVAFVLFGAAMTWPAFEGWRPVYLVYALLSLTIIRMAPIALSLLGLNLRGISVLFLAWFGPRGIASIIFVLVIVGEYPMPHHKTIYAVVVTTVLCSILLHGLTAYPASERYALWAGKLRRDEAAEHRQTSEMPVRHSMPERQ